MVVKTPFERLNFLLIGFLGLGFFFSSLSRLPSDLSDKPARHRIVMIPDHAGRDVPRWRTNRRVAPGARERERERERAKESDGVLGRARQLWLPTMAAQGGLQLRVSSRREKREDERERRRVTERYATRSSATTRERERETHRPTDRPIDHCLLGLLTSFVLLCILQRGRGQDEVIVQAFSVPSAGFQGSPSGGRVPGAPCCCVESEDYPCLRDGDTAVCFRSFCSGLLCV